MVFTIRKPFFHFSPSRVFSKKKAKKRSKTAFRKKPQKTSLRGPVWDPKSIKIDVGAAGNRQNRAKKRKNGMQKFMRFCACEKNAKKREKRGRDAPPRRNARCQREVRRVALSCLTLQGYAGELPHENFLADFSADDFHTGDFLAEMIQRLQRAFMRGIMQRNYA